MPQFLQDLPLVLDLFPDARLICLDRRLDEVVPSSASLVWNQMRIHSDHADPHWVGREWLRKTMLRRRVANRTLTDRTDVSCICVSYEAMNLDWRREMGRIYDFLGLDLPPALVGRMAHWLDSAKDHVGHRYSLGQFGLSEADFDGVEVQDPEFSDSAA